MEKVSGFHDPVRGRHVSSPSWRSSPFAQSHAERRTLRGGLHLPTEDPKSEGAVAASDPNAEEILPPHQRPKLDLKQRPFSA